MAQTDRQALVAFYNATDGAAWANNENWNTNAALFRWYGVKVNTNGRVVELRLEGNNLRGRIPEELGKLTALQDLNLYKNQLSGPIPPELGKLAALTELWLQLNQLTGPIPPELGELRELQELYLYNNRLTGTIPRELGALSTLQWLALNASKLTGSIPPELGELAALQYLSLSNNQLIGPIPAELGNLAALEELSLWRNQLSGSVPPELGNLKELKKLWLYNNELTGPIPAELGNLTALEKLVLVGNQLSGTIPKELGSLIKLEKLYLDNNQLTEIPPAVLELCRGKLQEPSWDFNPWSRPPATVLKSGLERALGWWKDVQRFGLGKSTKLKLVLVGLAEAGKTTMVLHFTRNSVPKQCDRTVGIEITRNWKPSDRSPLQVSVWDFAGQAAYYATHQLFLTKGALFVLVVDLHAFAKEVKSGVHNFTDPHRRIYWWLEMLHMRVPGAAVALVGSHVDLMEIVDADRARIDLHTVVSKFIQDKAENASRGESNRLIGTESTTNTANMGAKKLPDGVKAFPRGGSLTRWSESRQRHAQPLVLHNHVFMVSVAPTSVLELQQWVVEAAYGRECPRGFNFPAVDQDVSKAWIEAYDAMDVLKETAPCVLWVKAVEEFENRMGGRLPDADDAGKVLLRAMQHLEAEGSVLLSLADAAAPVATDMLHLDPSWLIELVRRLADHNLLDKKKQGTIEQGLRKYAKQHGLHAGPLVDTHSIFCKSGRLNKDYLCFLWMHRENEALGAAVVLTEAEFKSIVSIMQRLLVMYKARGADNLVVPARLPQYGNQRVMTPDTISDIVLAVKCSFGQVYPPPGIVGAFLAWSAQQIASYEECWQHGAFFSYKYDHARYDVFLYESEVEEAHEDGTVSMFAGLTLGIQGPPPQAADVVQALRSSLEELVSDSAHGYPGLAGLMYFRPAQKIKSSLLVDLRSVLDNVEGFTERMEVAAGRSEVVADRMEIVAGSLEETARNLCGPVRQLLGQALLASTDTPSQYPRLVLLRPEQETKDGETHERIQHRGWDKWTKCLRDVGLHHKFRLFFLCEHDLSEVPCGPDGRGFPIENLKDWVKQCVPLVQVSLWMLRVAVGTVSNVDLPLHEVLGALVQATGAELLDGMGKIPGRIESSALPVFGEGATETQKQGFKRLQGTAYDALCDFMRQAESPTPQCLPGFIPCRRPTVINWRDHMVQVKNHSTGGLAWVLKANEPAYLGGQGGTPEISRAPFV